MFSEYHDLLETKFRQYNTPDFTQTDPVQIPRSFSVKEDIEISAFLTATIAWGNRTSVINSARKMMDLMGNAPYDFVMTHSADDLARFDHFVHRTFQPIDMKTFVRGLKNIYENHGGLESVFASHRRDGFMHNAIHEFKERFFEIDHQPRTHKHIADPLNGSHAKRIHLFLKWMVRKDKGGIDIGIWDSIPSSDLSCPLDVHTGKVGRALGFITTKQDNLKALTQLDTVLRKFDPVDPVKYDVALFSLSKEGTF